MTQQTPMRIPNRRRSRVMLAAAALCAFAGCSHTTDSNPIQLAANAVNPLDVNAVSQFNSCVGHAYPETNSPNSGKNYFWPNSTNFGTDNQLSEYAACSGTISQNNDDTNDPAESVRGETVHLYCDGSSTSLRYFHINLTASLLGHHVKAGDLLGYGVTTQAGQAPASSWQNSSNIDIAVNAGDDSRTQNYFSSLDAPTFAAWSVRGLTSMSQTIVPGDPSCATFASAIGGIGIFSFTPSR
jgi:hypothetical protein